MARNRQYTTAHRKRAAIDAYLEYGMVTVACHVAGIHRRTWYRWRETDPAFNAMAEDARATVTDSLEGEAIRRAMDGSDSLLMFLLRGLKPETYGNRKYTNAQPQSGKPIRSDVQVADILGPDKESDE